MSVVGSVVDDAPVDWLGGVISMPVDGAVVVSVEEGAVPVNWLVSVVVGVVPISVGAAVAG